MFATFTYRYDVIFRETLKSLTAISTSISVRCLDIVPLFKRQSVNSQIEQCAPFGALSVMQKIRAFFVGLFPFLSCRTTLRFVTSVPISVLRQFMFSVGSVAFTMFCQDVFAVIGIMFVRAFTKLLSIPFTVSLYVINETLVAGVAITSRSVSFLLGASRAYYNTHYSIISQKG